MKHNGGTRLIKAFADYGIGTKKNSYKEAYVLTNISDEFVQIHKALLICQINTEEISCIHIFMFTRFRSTLNTCWT